MTAALHRWTYDPTLNLYRHCSLTILIGKPVLFLLHFIKIRRISTQNTSCYWLRKLFWLFYRNGILEMVSLSLFPRHSGTVVTGIRLRSSLAGSAISRYNQRLKIKLSPLTPSICHNNELLTFWNPTDFHHFSFIKIYHPENSTNSRNQHREILAHFR